MEELGWPDSIELISKGGGDIVEVTAAIRSMNFTAKRLVCSLWGNYAYRSGEVCPYTREMVYELMLACKAKSTLVAFVVCGTREAFLPLNPAYNIWYDDHMSNLRGCIRGFGGTVFTGSRWLPTWTIADAIGHLAVESRPSYARFLRLCINKTVSSKIITVEIGMITIDDSPYESRRSLPVPPMPPLPSDAQKWLNKGTVELRVGMANATLGPQIKGIMPNCSKGCLSEARALAAGMRGIVGAMHTPKCPNNPDNAANPQLPFNSGSPSAATEGQIPVSPAAATGVQSSIFSQEPIFSTESNIEDSGGVGNSAARSHTDQLFGSVRPNLTLGSVEGVTVTADKMRKFLVSIYTELKPEKLEKVDEIMRKKGHDLPAMYLEVRSLEVSSCIHYTCIPS
jgi:hypothetical protein